MYQRKLTDEVINLFDVGYDPNFIINFKDKNGKPQQKVIGECLTFPIHDKNGNVIFIARRAIHSKIFHYPEGVLKPVYGIFQLPKNCNEIILCESIINALTCYVYGKYAVALNGTGTPTQIEQLKKLPCRKFILGLDPDDAGERGRQKLKKSLGKEKIITEYVIPPGKDINDLTKQEFDSLKEIF
jgi:DNA primase